MITTQAIRKATRYNNGPCQRGKMTEEKESLVAKRYSNPDNDFDTLQSEVDELEAQRNNTQEEDSTDNETPDTELSSEEKTFKKRYADLRRHQQKEKEQLEGRISELEQQVQQQAKQDMEIPTTKEELEQWANQYPDLYNVIQAVADDRAQRRDSELDNRLKTVEERERQSNKEQALSEIRKEHEDFDSIIQTDEFHDWAEQQATWVQNALYDNEEDPTPVIDVLDLYKARTKKKGKSNKQAEREAANPVKTSQRQEQPEPDTGKVKFKESELANMNPAEFEKRLEEIEKAQREGKIDYDLKRQRQSAARQAPLKRLN